MRRAPLLRPELLESRDTPANFGTPWPDGQHLTLSFAPDGTDINGRSSDLNALLSGLGPDAETQVLRAFQTWAVAAGLNIALVDDNGAAFGTGRVVQGDPRFGDIRVGGAALAADVLAVTTPFALFNNYSGDVVVNTATGFRAGGYDLYTVLLHEAGHALGLGDNSDPTSVMDGTYIGPRTGLSAGDVAAIQALYGARPADVFEGSTGNDTLSTATPYPGIVTADLTTTQDVDIYRFTPGLLVYGVTARLQASDLSMLTARVDLLNSSGRVLATAAVTDPTQNDVTLSYNGLNAGGTYYVRVSSARPDAFGVGTYSLELDQQSILSGVTGLIGGLLDGLGLNTTLATATNLLAQAPTAGPQTEYSAEGRFLYPSVTDYYHIAVPATATGPVNLLLTVWGRNGLVLNPWIEVDDALGNKLAAQVLTADGNTTTVQVLGLTPGQDYFLKISSDTGGVGRFHLSGSLRADVAEPQAGGSGTLDADDPAAAATLTLAQSGQAHFALSADGSPGIGRAVQLFVTAADGRTVAQLIVPVGRGRSVDVFLPAGQYQVEVRTTDSTSPVTFALGLSVVTDPIGPVSTDPTTTPEQPPDGTGTSPPPPVITQTGSTPPPSPPAGPPQDPQVGLTPMTPDEGVQWF